MDSVEGAKSLNTLKRLSLKSLETLVHINVHFKTSELLIYTTTCVLKYLGYSRLPYIKRDKQNDNSTVIKTYKWLSYTVNLATVIIFTTTDLRLSVRHGKLHSLM